jgi:AraC-like DNA-binding protein
LHDVATFALEAEGPGLARIAHEYRGVPGGAGRHAVDLALGGLVVVARQCTEARVVPVEVRFRHAPPADPARYERLFGTRPRYGQPADALVIEERVLDLPFARTDPGLAAVLGRHADALLAALPPLDASLTDRVRALVAEGLRGGDPQVKRIAAKLKMSERTLQRKLAAEGTTFDALVDRLREELARRYLTDERLAIAEVAFLLGYSEPSAFHRAFKRWTGTTPGELRAHADTRTMGRGAPPGTDGARQKR